MTILNRKQMRTILSLLACLMLGALNPAGAASPQSPVAALNFSKYASENSSLPPLKKNDRRVVFYGGSVSEGWMAQHPEFFNDNSYLCRGISGQSSYALLLRFRADAIDLNPTCIVLGVGEADLASGDGNYDEDRTFANIVSMCELARIHGIYMVLTSVLPAESYYWNQEATSVPDKIESLNHRIKAYAQANKIPYADYYSPLVHPGDRALPVTFSDDGVHPNRFGYTIMEPVINAILKKIPSKSSVSK